MPPTLSYVQFAAKHGLVTDYDVQGHIHAGLRAAHMPKSFHRAYQTRLQELQDARTEGMRKYADAIRTGDVIAPKEPSSLERLIARSEGDPSMESTQAAKRTLARIFERRKELEGTSALSRPDGERGAS